MSEYDDNFFEGKRPWSIIKDTVLSSYMSSYLPKVNKRGQHITLIDGYAGPGIFNDNTEGSPLVICKTAEKYAKGNYTAFFFNIKKEYHERLELALSQKGYANAKSFKTNTLKIINQLPQILSNNTVFLYLDPFGLKGCGFDQLEPFLLRNPNYSTEIVLTMCMPVLHRLAAPHAVKQKEVSDIVKRRHQTLTTTLGGEYWKNIMYQDNVDAETKELQLIEAYLSKLGQYLPFKGYCPVRQKSDSRIKYFIVFLSRHPDAMLLMNDIMYNAYFSNMHKADYEGKILGELDWRKDMPLPEERSVKRLGKIVENLVLQYPGASRNSIWLKVVNSNFMQYYHGLYLETLTNLVQEQKIDYQPDPQTKRRNATSKLYPIIKSS